MKYEFGKVINGIAKYLDSEMYPGMNDFQEFLARVLVGRVINNQEHIKGLIMDNGFIRSFGIIDDDGMVDVDSLMTDIKKEIARKEKVCFNIPMFGKVTFRVSDADTLHKHIAGSVTHHENN